MKIVATSVHGDEPCYSLVAGPRLVHLPNGAKERHWVERVYVIRGDAMAEYCEDYGPAEDYAEVPVLMLPSFGENTVAQLQEMAERHRHDDKWIKRRKEMLAESTLIADVLRDIEENREYIANRSQFGPGISVQRNIYDSNVAKRRLRAAYQKRTGIIPHGGR